MSGTTDEEWLEQLESAYRYCLKLTTRVEPGEWREARRVNGGVYRYLMRYLSCTSNQASILVGMLSELGLIKMYPLRMEVKGGQIDKQAALKVIADYKIKLGVKDTVSRISAEEWEQRVTAAYTWACKVARQQEGDKLVVRGLRDFVRQRLGLSSDNQVDYVVDVLKHLGLVEYMSGVRHYVIPGRQFTLSDIMASVVVVQAKRRR